MKKLAVVIGRFQPVHLAHLTLLNRALRYDHVLVLLGSSFKARDWKNPFSWKERQDFICRALGSDGLTFGPSGVLNRITFEALKDYPYSDNRWVFQVQKIVEDWKAALGGDVEVILVGMNKDESSYYLKLFPQWKSEVSEAKQETEIYSATDVRAAMFEGRWDDVKRLTSPSVSRALKEWMDTPQGMQLQEEYLTAKKAKLVLAYKDESGNLVEAKYVPIFHTVDSVILWRGHVLLIRRRSMPGKGLWALPGGFLRADEWIRDGAVRERQEESKIKFYSKGSRKRLHLDADWCKASHTFDYPDRSLRGRTITTGFLWVIPAEYEVDIEAADDADRAQWFPLYDVLDMMSEELFEDHQSIIAHFALGA